MYRSLTKEFRKIYKLNKIYLNPTEYISALDEEVTQSDYTGPEDDVVPGADPTAVSAQEKQQRVQALMQILQLGTIDPMKVTMDYLEAHEVPQAETYIKQPQPPQPDPKVQAMQEKARIDAQKAQNDIAISREKIAMERDTKEQELAHKQQLQAIELRGKMMEGVLKGREAQQRMIASTIDHRMQLQQSADNHRMNMIHSDQQAKQKAQQLKQKPQTTSKEK